MSDMIARGMAVNPNKPIYNQQMTPGTQYGPSNLTFYRRFVKRHFYDLSIPLEGLDCSDVSLMLANGSRILQANDTSTGFTVSQSSGKVVFTNNSGSATQQSRIKISGLQPYSVYEIDVSAATVSSTGAQLFARFSNSPATLITTVTVNHATGGGVKDSNNNILSSTVFTPPYTLRIQFAQQGFSTFIIQNGVTNYLGYSDFSGNGVNWGVVSYAGWNFWLGANLGVGESITISATRNFLTCGGGQADPRVIKLKDGTPLISEGKLWLTMTTRGFGNPGGQSKASVFSLTLSTMQFALEGEIYTDTSGTNSQMQTVVGVGIVYDYDTGQWILFAGAGGAGQIVLGSTLKDPRRGITIFTMSKIVMPYTGSSYTGVIEDPDLVYDASVGKWRMTFGLDYTSGGGSYPEGTALVESANWIGPYTEVTPPTAAVNNETGQSFANVGGSRYIFAGRADSKYNIYSYPGLSLLGQLNVIDDTGAFRTWPTIIPIPDGEVTRYIMITFDRTNPYGNYSYGTLYVYEADMKNTGYEFNIRQFGGTI